MDTTSGFDVAVIVIVALLGFLGFFCTLFFGIFYFISRLAWARLAEVYRSDAPFVGEQHIPLYAYVGLVKYGRLVRVGAGPQGLHLSCMYMKDWFPPLLFPWADVTVQRKWAILGANYEFRFRQRPTIPLTIHEQTVLRLAQEAGSAWPSQPPDIGD